MNEKICPAMDACDLTEIAERMPGGFFVYRDDEKGTIIYANNVVFEIFGCKNAEEFAELTGGTFRGMICPEDRERVDGEIFNQIKTHEKQIDYVEYRIVRRDGIMRRVNDYGRRVHTKYLGEVYYVFINDITEQHKVKKESRRREKVIEGLSTDFLSIYLLNLDTGKMRTYRNQSEYFKKITRNFAKTDEYDGKEIFSVYAEKFILPEDREVYLSEIEINHIRERLKNENSYTVNYRCFGENDSTVYSEMVIIKTEEDHDEDHVIIGYRDVTAQTLRIQKQLSEKIALETDLEREKRANEVKSSFLFNISHDIRTPMNSIMGFTALARKNIDNPAKLELYLSKVDESNKHLLALIDDLLEMSRIDYGRFKLRSDICNLREELGIVVDMFKGVADGKKISIEEDINLTEENVKVDVSGFSRIMGNLLGNAVKFTPEGGTVKISARQKQVSKSGYARYEFSVSDNGVGMTEDFMRRMFESFEREENSTRSGEIGTGLGLTIVKKLLDMMGGSIAVKSKKGEGSTFTVDLPLKFAVETSDAENVIPEVHKEAGVHRILLVEDIEVNRLLAETVLTEYGFWVESVPDGCDAVEAIKNHPPYYYDLILMDIQMPVMNGYEATRAIRALRREDTATLPIVALSANAREEDKKMSMESGMNSHVAKPFDIAHLIETVGEHIAARKR